MTEIKKQPSSEESEIVVIGSCLLSSDGSVYDNVSQIVTSSDFFYPKHKILFDAIGQLVSKGEEVSEITLLEKVRKDGNEDGVGGIQGIYGVLERVTTSGQAIYASREVKDKSRLRELIRVSGLASEKAYSMEEDAETIGAVLGNEIQAIQDVHDSETGDISEATKALREKYTEMSNGTYVIEAMPTYIKQIDEKLEAGGIAKGEVMVIAAPTSCGKTQLALNIVLQAAVTNGKPGTYFSFEMEAEKLANRMIQTSSACNIKKLREGVMPLPDQKKVFDALEKLEKSPIQTCHYVRNIEELRAKTRTAKRKNDIEWVVIDYLQLCPWDKSMKKHDGIAEVSHQIKMMAVELGIKVILLAQVNREGAKRDTGLTLYDLKDSGDIENDADIILLMWPDGRDVDEARCLDKHGKPYVSLNYNIAKQREGERDQKGKFMFRNHIGRFH